MRIIPDVWMSEYRVFIHFDFAPTRVQAALPSFWWPEALGGHVTVPNQPGMIA